MDTKAALKKIIKGEIKDDPKTLTLYSRDASIFKVKPKFVIFPKDTEDIKSLVKFVSEPGNHHLSLTARSAGTDMSGGPLNESIILDFTKHFNGVIKVTGDSATTQPGVFYRDFEKKTLEHGGLMPAYTSSREICAVGGMVANNAGGEKTLTYGKVEDYVEELTVVFSDGNEYKITPLNKGQLYKKIAQDDFEGQLYKKIYNLIRENRKILDDAKPTVSKNSAGYYLWNVWDGKTFNLNKLLVGSQGTLGIITEIKFKLVKPENHSRMLVIFLDDLTDLAHIVNKVLEHKPESFECFDDQTLKYAIQNLKDISKILKLHHFLKFLWELMPQFKQHLTKTLPKLILIAEFTGNNPNDLDARAVAAEKDLRVFKVDTRITESNHESRKYWIIRRESFNLLRKHSKGKHASPFIDDIVVKPEHLPKFIPELDKVLRPYSHKMIYTLAGHIGDGNFHIIPLINLKNPESREVIREVSKRVFKLVFKYNGSMTGEHNDGLARSMYLEQMYGEKIYKLFKETKQIFDPENIFNPGKKVGSSWEYSKNHILKEN